MYRKLYYLHVMFTILFLYLKPFFMRVKQCYSSFKEIIVIVFETAYYINQYIIHSNICIEIHNILFQNISLPSQKSKNKPKRFF